MHNVRSSLLEDWSAWLRFQLSLILRLARGAGLESNRSIS
jgi:hypothetical protein